MAATPRSFSSVTPTGTLALGGTASLPTPTGLAVGDWYVIFALFGQVAGNVTATVPTGFTNYTPTGAGSGTRLEVMFARYITDAAALTAVGSTTTLTNPAGGIASRLSAVGLAVQGSGSSAPVAATYQWLASAATSITLNQPASGDLKVFGVFANTSSTSTHPVHTPDAGGVKVTQANAYATGVSPTGDPQSDTITSVHTGATTVTFSASEANFGSLGFGFVNAAVAATATLTPATATGTAVALSPGNIATVTLTPVTGLGVAVPQPAPLATITLTPATGTGAVVPFSRAATIASWLATQTYFAAHRGGGDNYPEHTMAAYDNAYTKGILAIELSVHQTADGVFICHHDLDMTRMTGTLTTNGDTRTIASTNYADLAGVTNGAYATEPSWSANTGKYATTETTARQPIPLLTDVLNKYLGKVVLLIEPKNGNDATALLALLETYGRPTASVVWKQVASSNAGTATARSRGYFVWGYITQVQTIDSTTLATAISRSDMLGVNFLDTDARITQVVAAGNAATPRRRVMAWEMHRPNTITTNGQRQLGTTDMRALGVEGFMTSNLNAVNTTPEPYAVTLTPATGTGAPQSLTPAAGATAVTLTPAAGLGSAPAVGFGTIAIALTPAVGVSSAVPLSTGMGPITFALTPALGSGSARSLSPVGVGSMVLTPAFGTGVATSLRVASRVTLTPASGFGTAVALYPSNGITTSWLYRMAADRTWEPLSVTRVH